MEPERNDDLKNAPGLREMDRKNPFIVPEGYFETLSSRIQDKINAPQSKSVWDKLFQPLQRPTFAYASITIAMLICAGVYFNQKQNRIPAKQIADATINADDIYDSDLIYDYDENTLAELYTNSNKQQTSTETEDYLIDANADESDLIDAL